jgi:hypothetical protein
VRVATASLHLWPIDFDCTVVDVPCNFANAGRPLKKPITNKKSLQRKYLEAL